MLVTQLPAELDAAIRLAIAALVGLGVGLEREWSGHTTGPNARLNGHAVDRFLGLSFPEVSAQEKRAEGQPENCAQPVTGPDRVE